MSSGCATTQSNALEGLLRQGRQCHVRNPSAFGLAAPHFERSTIDQRSARACSVRAVTLQYDRLFARRSRVELLVVAVVLRQIQYRRE
jgi:hypothetical protein